MLKREHKVSHISSEAIFAIPAMKPSKVVFAVIFCLCLMISDVKFETSSYLRSVSHEVFKPISWVIKLPSYLIDTSSNFLSSRSSLNAKLKDLEKENFELKSTNLLMKKLSVDFERLNSLWSSSALNEDRFIISKKNLLYKSRVLLINATWIHSINHSTLWNCRFYQGLSNGVANVTVRLIGCWLVPGEGAS